MKKLIFVLVGLCIATSIAFAYSKYFRKTIKAITHTKVPESKSKFELKKIAQKQSKYLKDKNFNDSIVFIFNVNQHSGKKRFFVYDIKNDNTITSGLVTHGSGKYVSDSVQFSNQDGSWCTSLGRYKIGEKYNGEFGTAYKLHGLDKTNNNAFKRFVVLHSHSCVPSNEVYPAPICESWGCPTVSPSFLKELETVIDNSKKPIVLLIQKL